MWTRVDGGRLLCDGCCTVEFRDEPGDWGRFDWPSQVSGTVPPRFFVHACPKCLYKIRLAFAACKAVSTKEGQ